jgi:hypothetical protein
MPMNPRLLRPTEGGFRSPDADARAYLAAVRQADGANLEPAVAKAISDFITGCKADGIWNAIKASCILAGARTLTGALTPLKGPAPTNNGPFVSGDYARGGATPGLVGNGSSKYLDSGRDNDADPQDDFHASVFGTSYSASSSAIALLGAGLNSAGSTALLTVAAGVVRHRNRSQLTADTTGSVSNSTLVGVSRTNSTQISARVGGASETLSLNSQTPLSSNLWVFGRNGGTPSFSASRLAFYSIGESLDLALLETRVSTLMTAIGAAIP